MKLSVLILAALLTGCATCDRHPVMCTVAAGVIIGSIAASEWHDKDGCVSGCRPFPRVSVK